MNINKALRQAHAKYGDYTEAREALDMVARLLEPNIAMAIDKLVSGFTSDYMGSDDVINDQASFRWDFTLNNSKHIIHLISKEK